MKRSGNRRLLIMPKESIESSQQQAIWENEFRKNTAKLEQIKREEQEKKNKQKKAGDTDDPALEAIKAAQKAWRIFNLVCALSLYALIITVITMHLQLIFGNWLKIKKIPSLHWIEIAILIILDFIIFMFILIATGVFAALVAQLKWLGILAPILEMVK